ncbi:hypothetical protein [Micromonospora sp. NPDC047738]
MTRPAMVGRCTVQQQARALPPFARLVMLFIGGCQIVRGIMEGAVKP